MNAPKNWKKLQRHELSAEYRDISGKAKELAVANLKQHGIIGKRKIILHDGKVLDGWQLYSWCLEANIKPEFATIPHKMKPEVYVETVNDLRRHETTEQANARIEARRSRVADSRRAGESTRVIAEAEQVSEKTIRNDISILNAEGSAVDPTDNIVIGKDGGKRKATIYCGRCQRFINSGGSPIKDCPQCRAERSPHRREPGEDPPEDCDAKGKPIKKEKPPAKPRDALLDGIGGVIPDHCRDAFADPGLPTLIAELEQSAACITPERWIKQAGKLTDHYGFILIEKFNEHAYEALNRVQLALEALKAGIPFAVCPKCSGVESKKDGKTCRGCRGYGHVPEHKYKELAS